MSHNRLNATQRRRRGIASVIAMLFMVLFATLSLGFYAATTTSVQVASNARYENDAMYAAESGLQFMSYQLRSMEGTTSSDPATIFTWVTSHLDTTFTGTLNMKDATSNARCDPASFVSGTTTTYYAPGYTLTNNKARPNWMRLGTNAGTTFLMLQLDTSYAPAKLWVTSVGKSGGANPSYRALRYELKSIDHPTVTTTTSTSTQTVQTPWAAPNGTIITYSPVSFTGGGVTINANITAVTSSVPLTMGGGGNSIHGTFSYPSSSPAPTGVGSNGNTVTTIAKIGSAPTPPTIDTSPFATLVPSATATGTGVVKSGTSVNNYVGNNIRIKANTNPSFSNATINGVVYIESPNKVTFGGGSHINGVIVTDNVVAYNSSTKNNSVILNNGSTLNGASSISTTGMSAADKANVAALQAMTTGSMVLAPNAFVEFAGGLAMQNSAAIVGNQVQFDNIGGATNFKGIILQLGSLPFSAAGGIGLNSSTGTTTWPGITTTTTQTVTNTVNTTVSSVTVAVNRSTYTEIDPWQFVK